MPCNRREFMKKGAVVMGGLPIAHSLLGTGCLHQPPKSVLTKQPSTVTGLPEDTIEKLLTIAMGKGGDFAEVYFENSQVRSLNIQENTIRNTQLRYSLGVGIRVLSGHKTGYAYSDDLSMKSLEEAANVAANIAQSAANPGPFNVNPKQIPNYYTVELPLDDVTMEKKVGLARRAYDYGIKQDNRVSQLIVFYEDLTKQFQIGNTEGLIANDKQCFSMLGVFAIVVEKDRREKGGYADGGRLGFELYDTITPEYISGEAVRIAIRNISAEKAPSGPMEVVLNGRYAGVMLHEAIGHPLEGDMNRKKQSLYSEKMGEQICPSDITIIDDGTYAPKEGGTINVDDEGTLSRRTTLVENGKLVRYMQDRLNAKLMNTEPTGNGRRQSFRHIPYPRMTNTMMLPGKYPQEEIIASVKKGFYAKAVSNGQVNIASGDFMFFVDEAYLIEDGKITKPVKGASLIGNGPKVLSQVTMVGDDFHMGPSSFICGKEGQSVHVGFGMPTVKVSEITVGGTQS